MHQRFHFPTSAFWIGQSVCSKIESSNAFKESRLLDRPLLYRYSSDYKAGTGYDAWPAVPA
ncbi:MAG: hypothetical protein PHH11_10695 [Methylomonas sp.]|nr:hypothetical protein [Methylomonas sp.]